MEIGLVTAVFGAIGTFVGFLITFFTFVRNRDKDVKKDATEKATTNAKLDMIINSVENVHVDLRVEQKERAILSERVAKVEESARAAHKRIDEMGGCN